jgi:hypothetical protein
LASSLKFAQMFTSSIRNKLLMFYKMCLSSLSHWV